MKVTMRYHGRSQLRQQSSGPRILEMAPNLVRDRVAFDATLKEPIRFREAISALHDVVINDLTFQPRDKTAWEQWKAEQRRQEQAIRQDARKQAQDEFRTKGQPSPELRKHFSTALNRYWRSRRQLNKWLRSHNTELWRKLMPFDPVITVADDVVFFECFSTDESSYGCLSVDRDCFGTAADVALGTTNVDYSWDLYHNFQSLRTYRETRFNVNPEGFEVRTEERETWHEEKIELPEGWLRGFMQLQAAMGLPMKRVPLGVEALYSLLAFLKRNKAKTSPRAIRFELTDGQSPQLVLEPWEKPVISASTRYRGPACDPIRVWGRRRLLTLARLLPLVTGCDVYLLGTGLPAFWVVHLGNMRLTLGLSGWTANDWTRGSAVQMLMPFSEPGERIVAGAAELLNRQRSASLQELSAHTDASPGDTASALNQLALRGQVIFDLGSSRYRWRQVLPMELSDREMGPPHPEQSAARILLHEGGVQITSQAEAPRGGTIVCARVKNQNCEALISDDGIVKKGKCRCSWHFQYGVRNGPCRHIQATRDLVWLKATSSESDWYTQRLKWSNSFDQSSDGGV